MAIPIALLVDDGAPVNTTAWQDPPHNHPVAIPNRLLQCFADLCERYDVRGKFSVLPMPCALGGIDGTLNGVPRRELTGFLRIVRTRLATRFDITPEILTHLNAYRLTGGFHHVYEDEWIARATVREMTDYIALALTILDHVGLPATGVTSPWDAGCHNERLYAEAMAAAQWRVHRRPLTWYFLHVIPRGPGQSPWVSRRNTRNNRVVVSIPANTADPFWDTQRPMASSRRAARAAATRGVDHMLSRDGRKGRIAQLVRQGCPVLILTHWPSLFSDGTDAGLWGLEQLLHRLEQVYGSDLAWYSCSELAEQAARNDP